MWSSQMSAASDLTVHGAAFWRLLRDARTGASLAPAACQEDPEVSGDWSTEGQNPGLRCPR